MTAPLAATIAHHLQIGCNFGTMNLETKKSGTANTDLPTRAVFRPEHVIRNLLGFVASSIGCYEGN
jgi:hypothetical protein